MDRRYIVAFLFSILILLGYPYYLKLIGVTPKEKVIDEKILTAFIPPSPPPAKPNKSRETFPFKNDLFDILFTNQGGNVLSLRQGDARLYEAAPDEGGIFGIQILHEAKNLSEEIFQLEREAPAGPPRFVYEEPRQYRIRKSFFVGNDKPNLVLEVEIENLSERERHFSLAFQYALKLGLGFHNSREETMVKMASFSGGEIHLTNLSAIRKKPSVSAGAIDWHGLVRKYYALLIKPDQKAVSQETRLEADRLVSELKFTPLSVLPGQTGRVRFLIYAGPQRFESLKSFGVEFEKIFSHGALGFLKVLLLGGLNFFYRLTANYGLAILVITLLIKLLFTPLTHVSYQSMGKMQALQPKVKALQKQHQKDAGRLNKELMELYRRNRVNPMLGCLPLVLQIPIFIAFYQVLSEAVELKGANFIFWIHDLSEPDRLFTIPTLLPFIGNAFNLLPILMIGSMLWQQKLTPQTAATPEQGKIMYLMPVIFGFVFYNLPSGLVLYWLVNNLLTIFHQLVIKRIPVILHHEDSERPSH